MSETIIRVEPSDGDFNEDIEDTGDLSEGPVCDACLFMLMSAFLGGFGTLVGVMIENRDNVKIADAWDVVFLASFVLLGGFLVTVSVHEMWKIVQRMAERCGCGGNENTDDIEMGNMNETS